MYLQFRLSPAHQGVFPGIPWNSLARNLRAFVAARGGRTENAAEILQVADLSRAVDAYLAAALAMRESLLLPSRRPLPVLAVASEEPADDAAWRLALPDYLLVPPEGDIPAFSWIEGWRIADLGKRSPLERAFPCRPLLLHGRENRECFFCGSYEHVTGACPDPWGFDAERDFPSELAEIGPDTRWDYYRGLAAEPGGLEALHACLRRPFQVRTMLRVARTTATHLANLPTAPERPSTLLRLHRVIEALERQDLEAAETALREFDYDPPGFAYYVIRGFFAIRSDQVHEAIAFWARGEELAETPLGTAYCALLQARAYLLAGHPDHAEAVLVRGRKADGGAPELVYWHAVVAALRGNASQVKWAVRTLARHPRWFMAAILEPYFLVCEDDLDEEFLSICRESEAWAHRQLSQIDTLLDQMEGALGPDFTRPFRLELRDWRGTWARQGCGSLTRASHFLTDFRQRLVNAGHKAVRDALARLEAHHEALDLVVEQPAYSQQGRRIRDEAAALRDEIRDAWHLLRHVKNVETLKDLHRRLEAGDRAVRELLEAHRHVVARDVRLLKAAKGLARILLAAAAAGVGYLAWSLAAQVLR
ncbi:hypothetical protein G3N55_02890 [Dissulfurirhabdus thermomarina]|uniref:Tetratricopeptide repeat protein n=1 Tax=Dissulfurirhabdus thermomarina TaxID=1765737 RepID=A0A6N9TMY6_DISTH|nr:hypothetical protein [Dissulfurirhabdus thermomarina]NDY41800.1 hypothetical protein [Dissulfurirhabdus thermomarina]NMX24059.1 hypothetical protein [Dissulfurirhabdus thermomarina]